MKINLNAIPRIWKPKATRYVALLARAFKETGVTNPTVYAYACASISHESSWNPKIENLHDSAARTAWSGKGLAQVTLESNYRKITELTGINFMTNPNLMFIPYYSLRAKAAHFVIHGMIPLIEQGQFEAAAGIYNAGKPDYRSNYTKNVANSTLEWLAVFSATTMSSVTNHSTSYGYTKPPAPSYRPSTTSNPLPRYTPTPRKRSGPPRYNAPSRYNTPPKYNAPPQYSAPKQYKPAPVSRYSYAKTPRNRPPVLNKPPRYTPSSSPTYTEPPKPARSSSRTYFVQRGDSLSSIASRFGVSLRTLLSNNRQIINANNIHVGDMINIPR
ncbi:MAG: LysM peptidoglycan-binding domain-containing protein [Methylococcales bacterium]|nr:LysM peptidoglycan-binding domain-containing protein [Methylococcales bacterium]